jgi:hypothetical protein
LAKFLIGRVSNENNDTVSKSEQTIFTDDSIEEISREQDASERVSMMRERGKGDTDPLAAVFYVSSIDSQLCCPILCHITKLPAASILLIQLSSINNHVGKNPKVMGDSSPPFTSLMAPPLVGMRSHFWLNRLRFEHEINLT